MSEFEFNYSRVNEKYQIIMTHDLIKSIRVQARILLIPFFRVISINKETSENGKEYPVLTDLAERIIESVFNEGEIDIESQEEANIVALEFISKLNTWQKSCLSFYFCSDEDFLDQLDVDEQNEIDNEENYENNEVENVDLENGKKIQKAAFELSKNENDLASYLVNELIHLQDIFSTEDISCWDASSITSANESFQYYAGKGQVLIPILINQFDYWNSIIGDVEEDEEEE